MLAIKPDEIESFLDNTEKAGIDPEIMQKCRKKLEWIFEHPIENQHLIPHAMKELNRHRAAALLGRGMLVQAEADAMANVWYYLKDEGYRDCIPSPLRGKVIDIPRTEKGDELRKKYFQIIDTMDVRSREAQKHLSKIKIQIKTIDRPIMPNKDPEPVVAVVPVN